MVSSTQAKVYRVAISGYYGFDNSGDEAVLRSILFALEQAAEEGNIKIEPVVLSGNPEQTTRSYGVEAVPRMKPAAILRTLRSCDALISGGGSLLQDVTSAKTVPYYTGIIKLAQWLGKPVFVYAQGIGPVQRGWLRSMVGSTLRKASFISVRDAGSASLLAELGIARDRIALVPDPVMGLPLPAGAAGADVPAASKAQLAGDGQAAAGVQPLVGVAIRYWRSDRGDLQRLAEALQELTAQRSVKLLLLPFHEPEDREASGYMMELLAGKLGSGSSISMADREDDPQRMLQIVSGLDMLLGMRLHSLIYAANQGVPLMGLSYDPKIDQFLQRLGIEAAASTEQLDKTHFVAKAIELIDRPDEWKKKHENEINLMRGQALLPAKQIVEQLRLL